MTDPFKISKQASAMTSRVFLAVDMAEFADCLYRFLNKYREQLSSSSYEKLVRYWKNLRSYAILIEYRRPEAHMLREFCDAEELLTNLTACVAETNNAIGASQ